MQMTPLAKRLSVFLFFLIVGWVLGNIVIFGIAGILAGTLVPHRWLAGGRASGKGQKREKELDASSSRRQVRLVGPEALLEELLEGLMAFQLATGIDEGLQTKADTIGRFAVQLANQLYSAPEYQGSKLLEAYQYTVRNYFVHALHYYRGLAPANRLNLKGTLSRALDETHRALKALANKAEAKELDVSQDTLADAAIFAELEGRKPGFG